MKNEETLTMRCSITPDRISHLAPHEVIVFGSNLRGMHGGGLAAYAHRHFGAVMGVGVGPQGQCYAIPTMFATAGEIKPYVDQFLEYAANHPQQQFLITRIGCGIAGFTAEAIAPLFIAALALPNVSLPKQFISEIGKLRPFGN